MIPTLDRIRASLAERPRTTLETIEPDRDPFRILVSCIISLRTKDAVTRQASEQLYAVARTAAEVAALGADELAELLYPAGFYRTKARQIRAIAEILAGTEDGQPPSDLESLLALPGVGPKTANLVRGLAFAIPSICVDIHVHRIANRLGWIETETPQQTEEALTELLPESEWIALNELLVTFGQNVCRPTSPFCSTCAVTQDCPRTGVEASR